MSRTGKMGIIIAVIVVVGAVVALREFKAPSVPKQGTDASDSEPGITVHQNAAAVTPSEPSPFPRRALPRLVDVGADRCIPCKMMAPILDELRREYADQFEVVFVDVWKNPRAGEPYRIRVIPTQIFYDASGRELFRHEGFFSKVDILATWKRLGFDFSKAVHVEHGATP